MKKFNIRLFGRGAWGECEVSFDQDPTVKMVEDKVAQCLKSGVLRLQRERFYHNVKRLTTTYEEIIDDKKEKQNILGTWV